MGLRTRPTIERIDDRQIKPDRFVSRATTEETMRRKPCLTTDAVLKIVAAGKNAGDEHYAYTT